MKKTIASLGYSCTKQSAEDEVHRKQCADKKAKNRGLFAHLFFLSLGLICLAFASLECPRVGCSSSCSHPEAKLWPLGRRWVLVPSVLHLTNRSTFKGEILLVLLLFQEYTM